MKVNDGLLSDALSCIADLMGMHPELVWTRIIHASINTGHRQSIGDEQYVARERAWAGQNSSAGNHGLQPKYVEQGMDQPKCVGWVELLVRQR